MTDANQSADAEPAETDATPTDRPDQSTDRPVPPERWEEVGRKALALLLQERQRKLDRAVGEVVATLDYGTPVDGTHLKNLRDAIEALETLVECDLTDLVPEATAFERTAGRVPVGRLYDALDVDRDEVRTLADSDET